MYPLTRNRRDEAGAALLLAIFFIISVSVLLGGIVSLSGTNLIGTTQLKSQRSTEYSADTVVDGAIQIVRVAAPSLTNPVCPTIPVVPGSGLVVVCGMGIPAGYYGRIVQFTACLTADSGTCATDPTKAVLSAEVIYNDLAAGCTSGAAPGCYGSSWGTSLTVVNWVLQRSKS